MNRKQIIDFCNERIFPQVPTNQFCNGDLKETVKLVSNWRIGKPANIEMIPVVDNGFLFINGEKVGRIARGVPCVPFSEAAYYAEGRILARQEAYYD